MMRSGTWCWPTAAVTSRKCAPAIEDLLQQTLRTQRVSHRQQSPDQTTSDRTNGQVTSSPAGVSRAHLPRSRKSPDPRMGREGKSSFPQQPTHTPRFDCATEIAHAETPDRKSTRLNS